MPWVGVGWGGGEAGSSLILTTSPLSSSRPPSTLLPWGFNLSSIADNLAQPGGYVATYTPLPTEGKFPRSINIAAAQNCEFQCGELTQPRSYGGDTGRTQTLIREGYMAETEDGGGFGQILLNLCPSKGIHRILPVTPHVL